MRVAHVITRLIIGGAQENTVYSVLGLAKKPGLRVSLISGPTTGPEGSLEPLFAPHPDLLSIVPSLIRPVRPWSDIAAYQALLKRFRQDRPDIVHTHSGKAGVLGRLAAAKAGVPLIIHTIHGPSFGRFQGPLANLLFTWAERKAGRVTHHFVVVANAMRNQYLAAGIGRPDQYTRVLSGFDLHPFLTAGDGYEERRKLGLSDEDIVIGKIARLVELKGHDDLIDVAPRLVKANPRLKFLLVGDGHFRGRFSSIARAQGLEKHFVFTGLVPPTEVPALLSAMDMLVHLSAREGLARALPQALATGKPVVAYDCDGANEVCFPGETGWLIEPGDKQTLEKRLLELANDPASRKKMGEKGREYVRERFSVEAMVDGLFGLYERLWRERDGVRVV